MQELMNATIQGTKMSVVNLREKLLKKTLQFIIFYIVVRLLFGINTSAPKLTISSFVLLRTTADKVLALIAGTSLISLPKKNVFY